MAEQNRNARELENREVAQRKQHWKPPELLPTPNPEPGYGFRYVRTALLGKVDPTNLSAKLREGWEPVKAADHPELLMHVDPNSRHKDNIEIGGLLLCKTPIEFVNQRNKYYADQSQAQTESVDNNFMRQSDARMPLFAERKSTSSFGKGK